MPWILLFFVLAIIEALPVDVSCVRLADIYWNATNPIRRKINSSAQLTYNKQLIQKKHDALKAYDEVITPRTAKREGERYPFFD
ncbi:unnamed protein product, partial [Ixodes hexagonus]